MTLAKSLRLLGFILLYPALALLPVWAGMAAGWHFALAGGPISTNGGLPLAIAAAGAIAGLPIIALGQVVTGWRGLSVFPVVATVAGLILMSLAISTASLRGLVSGFRPIDLFSALAGMFLLLSVAPYLAGIRQLWLAPRPPRP